MMLSTFIEQLKWLEAKQGNIEVTLKNSIPDMPIRGLVVDVEFVL